MKRSEINAIMREALAFMEGFGVRLPPFAHWSPEEMRARATPGLTAARLGWDITDYGAGRFDEMGLFLFTTRNGRPENLARSRGVTYAEKVMISRAGQLSPVHTHVTKTEDIINRSGGTLVVELFASAEDGRLDEHADIEVMSDAHAVILPAGGRLRLAPGASVTLEPGQWHAFWGEDGDVLIGEVSTVNDDLTDNVFRDPIGRFSDIEEDEAPWRLLVSDYEAWL